MTAPTAVRWLLGLIHPVVMIYAIRPQGGGSFAMLRPSYAGLFRL